MAFFKTNDNTEIYYEIHGTGRPLVMLHGWDQSLMAFCENVPVLAEKYQVITVDLRGHGRSAKPSYGYRISRLATDVHQLLESLDINDAVILGWSMGCSVVWSYWDLYRDDRISKIILVDEPPLCLINESNPIGFSNNPDLEALVKNILENTVEATTGFVDMMLVTEEGREKYFQQTLDESLMFPPQQCTTMLLNHVYTDWRDVIPTITLPTLIFAGEKSHVLVANNEWSHDHIEGSELKILKSAHMMFMEEPEEFNAAVMEFIG